MYSISNKNFLEMVKGFVCEAREMSEKLNKTAEELVDEAECYEEEIDEEAGWFKETIDILDHGVNENGLTPCPFCGSTDVHLSKDEQTYVINFSAYCDDCDAMGPIGQFSKDSNRTNNTVEKAQEAARKYWARRVNWKHAK
jgi:Lar family restriction alleviation protein